MVKKKLPSASLSTTLAKRGRLNPTSTVNIFKPFDDLDNATLSHLFSFIDAFDVLHLAKTSRRMYNLYKTTSTLRLLEPVVVYLIDKDEDNKSHSLRLESITVALTTRFRRTLTFEFPAPDRELLQWPDLVLADGEMSVRVKHTNKFTDRKKKCPIWKCHVTGGAVRDGEMILWKFLGKRLKLDAITLESFKGFETLDFIARHAPPYHTKIHIEDCDCLEEDVLRFLRLRPDIGSLEIGKFAIPPIPRMFFEDPAIRCLRSFETLTKTLEGLTADTIADVKWKRFRSDSAAVRLTPSEVKKLLDEWKEERREISEWAFPFPLGTWSLDQLWEFLFGRPYKKAATLKSKSGKKLTVGLDPVYGGFKTNPLRLIFKAVDQSRTRK